MRLQILPLLLLILTACASVANRDNWTPPLRGGNFDVDLNSCAGRGRGYTIRCMEGRGWVWGANQEPGPIWWRPVDDTPQAVAAARLECMERARHERTEVRVNAYRGRAAQSDAEIDQTIFRACMEAEGWQWGKPPDEASR